MSAQNLSFVDLAARLNEPATPFRMMLWQFACGMRVAMVGVVQSFDAAKQTVVVQLAVNDKLLKNLKPTDVAVPQLVDVPIAFIGGGGFTVCPPISAGDEALVIFNDMCIDAWYQNGGTNNNQARRRRHSLSDGVAIVGLRSQPRKLANYSTTTLQVRSDDGNTLIEVGSNEVTVKATNVTIDSNAAKVQGNLEITGQLTVDGAAVIDSRTFLTHVHTGVSTGGGNTGPVL